MFCFYIVRGGITSLLGAIKAGLKRPNRRAVTVGAGNKKRLKSKNTTRFISAFCFQTTMESEIPGSRGKTISAAGAALQGVKLDIKQPTICPDVDVHG